MIQVKNRNKYSLTLSNGEHEIVSDIAKNIGGEDLGLNPHELIEAALAACTTQTLVMYAGRKGWDLPALSVKVNILKEGTDSLIETHIHFGEIANDVKEKLMEIAKKCPIHKLLVSHIQIGTYEK